MRDEIETTEDGHGASIFLERKGDQVERVKDSVAHEAEVNNA